MSKFKGMIFARDVRESQSNGAVKRYRMPQELVKMLGQGTKVTFHGRVYDRTPTGQLVFLAYHGCHDGDLPADAGFPVTLSGTAGPITNEGDYTFTTTGDLMADLEIVAEVSDSNNASLQRVEFDLWVTVQES